MRENVFQFIVGKVRSRVFVEFGAGIEIIVSNVESGAIGVCRLGRSIAIHRLQFFNIFERAQKRRGMQAIGTCAPSIERIAELARNFLKERLSIGCEIGH